jgi:hypothetical protein
MYLEMLQQGLTQHHWSSTPADKGMLDFHQFTAGMAAAAMRVVIRDMSLAANAHTSSSTGVHVHDVSNDLHIITGHGTGDGKQGSVLQPVIIGMLKEQGIDCHVNPDNKGRLLVKGSELQQYIATATFQN